MKQSRIGQLQEKLDNSGIDGNPVISINELEELREKLIEFRKTAEDFHDKPLSYMVYLDIESIERKIEAKKNK